MGFSGQTMQKGRRYLPLYTIVEHFMLFGAHGENAIKREAILLWPLAQLCRS